MKGFARFTGTILLLIGLLVVLSGAYLMARGVLRQETVLPSLFGAPAAAGMLFGLRLIAGGLLVVQGLMLAAVGEGLWLIASVAAHIEKTGEHTAKMLQILERSDGQPRGLTFP